MSEWLRLVGEMKRRVPQDYFTTSQRAAYESLIELLRFPHQHVNFYGASGTGKTFVAWGLARALDGIHIPLPERLRDYGGSNASVILIDNAPTYEDDLRTLLADATLINAESIVFITHRAAALRMRQVKLDLPTPEDLRHVERTFGRLGFYEQTASPPSANLWQLLQCYV